MASLENTQKKLSDEISAYSALQKDYQKNLAAREQLDSQLNENIIVQEELELLPEDANVFKLTGPALIKHDLHDAKENVGNRIKYIKDEIKKIDVLLKDLEKKQATRRDSINKLQQQLQQAQVKAAVN
ncbi:prefoldin subunit 6-like protein [Dinothrombium tinctorium]|uniref:Probable prefoldin subunit 6 n=1 Tax=Dinothrombium tinctorium TaxID=1965070 RepID=A0A3S3PKM4_9ACAR|nr:prefoldin subunit 6-like protein [Dinothrombium tinctorium]RWS11956.1 prefoldin subunit 6-like protein [Dinothrombium tinctorium]RWS14469.1 prefoldin subunit 6-like protein [Dinothrombium tinctorium]RWS14474.1 prefoldin subunit 6-like protein [Dinothrombium tinctorium]